MEFARDFQICTGNLGNLTRGRESHIFGNTGEFPQIQTLQMEFVRDFRICTGNLGNPMITGQSRKSHRFGDFHQLTLKQRLCKGISTNSDITNGICKGFPNLHWNSWESHPGRGSPLRKSNSFGKSRGISTNRLCKWFPNLHWKSWESHLGQGSPIVLENSGEFPQTDFAKWNLQNGICKWFPNLHWKSWESIWAMIMCKHIL
jgi:hypothetical protein